jgi:GNAT superfamily N-acetyltransferase
MSAVLVRPLADADIDPVAALHVRAWRAGYAGIVPADVLAALDPAAFAARRREQAGAAGVHTVVAEDGAGIAGFASYGPYRGGGDQGCGELYAIYVDVDRWGAGTGRALLAAARAGLAAAGHGRLVLWVLEENHRGRRFYERAGLAPDGTRRMYTPRGSIVTLPELRYAGPLR